MALEKIEKDVVVGISYRLTVLVLKRTEVPIVHANQPMELAVVFLLRSDLGAIRTQIRFPIEIIIVVQPWKGGSCTEVFNDPNCPILMVVHLDVKRYRVLPLPLAISEATGTLVGYGC